MYPTKDITLIRQLVPAAPAAWFPAGRAQSPYHFFFGDESSLGLYRELKERLVCREHKYIGVLEMPEHSQALPEAQGLLVDVVSPGKKPAEHAISYLFRLERELWELWKEGTFYLAGKADAINEFKRALVDDLHILPAQLRDITAGLSER